MGSDPPISCSITEKSRRRRSTRPWTSPKAYTRAPATTLAGRLTGGGDFDRRRPRGNSDTESLERLKRTAIAGIDLPRPSNIPGFAGQGLPNTRAYQYRDRQSYRLNLDAEVHNGVKGNSCQSSQGGCC